MPPKLGCEQVSVMVCALARSYVLLAARAGVLSVKSSLVWLKSSVGLLSRSSSQEVRSRGSAMAGSSIIFNICFMIRDVLNVLFC